MVPDLDQKSCPRGLKTDKLWKLWGRAETEQRKKKKKKKKTKTQKNKKSNIFIQVKASDKRGVCFKTL